MYKLIKNPLAELFPTVPFRTDGILRVYDDTFIPFNLGNRDYKEYLEWVAKGNTASE